MDSTDSVDLIATLSSIIESTSSTGIDLTGNMKSKILVFFSLGFVVYTLTLISNLVKLHDGLQSIKSLYLSLKNWWVFKIPARKVVGNIADNKTELKIFVRDFFIQPGTPLYSREGLNGPIGIVPNVLELWPRVEGIGLSKILNALGQMDKMKNIEVIEMGKDSGVWDKNMIILGAQTQKCFDFYQKMLEVAYKITPTDIVKVSNGYKIKPARGYGYGIIIKCKNPFVFPKQGIGLLIGGFGVMGTDAAAHYFANHLSDLGKQFGRKSFGVVVRALITAGVQSTERLKRFDVTL